MKNDEGVRSSIAARTLEGVGAPPPHQLPSYRAMINAARVTKLLLFIAAGDGEQLELVVFGGGVRAQHGERK